MTSYLKTFLLLNILLNCAFSALTPRYLGTFKTENPAFIANDFNNGKNNLFISSFSGSPFTQGKIWYLEDFGTKMSSDISTIKTTKVLDGLQWPNLIQVVPKEVLGVKAIMIPDGFLVPGKSNGNIRLMTLDENNNQKDLLTLTESQSNTFYHTGVWVDLNGDGHLDLITARTIKSGFFTSTFAGELIWLENPGNLNQTPWKQHKLADGPDVMINIAELDGDDSTVEILAAEFFSKKISLNVIDKKTGTLKNRRVIDDKTAAAYNVYTVDINNDGKMEIIASNHDGSEDVSAVWCYEVPSDIINGNFNKIQLAKGFKTKPSILPGQASPGFVYTVHPQLSQKGKERPYILIAGDGSNSAYILTPKSTNGYDYDMAVLKELGGTVGSIGLGDYNNDGWLDFLVPNFDKGYVEVYTFAPTAQYADFLGIITQ